MSSVLYVNTCQLWDFPDLDGFQCHTLTNISEAADFIEEQHIDIILISIFVEDEGEEVDADFQKLVQHIKNIDALVPVFLLTNKNTVHLDALGYRLQLFGTIKYPATETQLWFHLSKAVFYNNSVIDKKKITMVAKTYEQTYKVSDIIAIRRSQHRKVELMVYDKQEKRVIFDEYSFRFPMNTFPVRFHVKRHLKQCHQSYLINLDHIVKVDTKDMEITLTYNVRVPVTAPFIKQFLKGSEF